MIFDEVITGFRVARGEPRNYTASRPDLTCLGKIIGGGLPVGAYGGRRDLMSQMAPVGPIYQAGTLSGNPVAVAAGLATLKALQEPGFYEDLEGKGGLAGPGTGPGRGPSGPAGDHQPGGVHAHPVFYRRAGDHPGGSQASRPEAIPQILSRPARRPGSRCRPPNSRPFSSPPPIRAEDLADTVAAAARVWAQ